MKLGVEHHAVAAPPHHKTDCILIDSVEKDRHVSSYSHGLYINILRVETNLCASYLHYLSKGLGDFAASYGGPLITVLYCFQRHVAPGVVMLKVRHMVPCSFYHTRPRIPHLFVSN